MCLLPSILRAAPPDITNCLAATQQHDAQHSQRPPPPPRPSPAGMAIWRAVRPYPEGEWPVDTGYVGWTAKAGASCLTHCIGDKLVW